jgi:hypothetical protein
VGAAHRQCRISRVHLGVKIRHGAGYQSVPFRVPTERVVSYSRLVNQRNREIWPDLSGCIRDPCDSERPPGVTFEKGRHRLGTTSTQILLRIGLKSRPRSTIGFDSRRTLVWRFFRRKKTSSSKTN